VVLGQADDSPLPGAVTLETIGLMVNPLTRELLPMRLTLARSRHKAHCLMSYCPCFTGTGAIAVNTNRSAASCARIRSASTSDS
jgi:hypothetical protein